MGVREAEDEESRDADPHFPLKERHSRVGTLPISYSFHMTENVRLARVTYSEDAHIWRLRLDPSPEHHPNGKLIELPGISGDLREPADWEKINLTLASWGVEYDLGGWRDEAGGWVAPILRHR
jgi:hypothetical protein